MDITTATADRVAATMTRKGMSTQHVATAASIPYTTLHRKLNAPADFTISEIGRLADALGVHPSELLPSEITTKAAA